MIVSIMQPAYLPWLGYFERLAMSDLHIVLDDVQIEHGGKTSFTNRNKIRTKSDWMWLTVPIKTAGENSPKICEVAIDNRRNWRAKHLLSIAHQYARSIYFDSYREELQHIYSENWLKLGPLLTKTTEWLKNHLNINTISLPSSTLQVREMKSNRVLDLCRQVGAKKYISGIYGREYLDIESFNDAGIEVIFHEYRHPNYPQNFIGFHPYMSTIDLLFNHGPASKEILLTTVRQKG